MKIAILIRRLFNMLPDIFLFDIRSNYISHPFTGLIKLLQ